MITYRKLKTEEIILQVYFPFSVEGGTVAVAVSVSSGEDSAPGSISLGPQNLQNNRVDLGFSGGIPGVVYEVFVALIILGDTYVESFYLAIGDDWSDYLPREFVPIPPTIVLPELYGELFLRSSLYPLDAPAETERAVLTLNSITVTDIVVEASAQHDTETATLDLNWIEVRTLLIFGETTEKERAILALNTIEVTTTVVLGDTTEKEEATLVLNEIIVKTEPNGSDTQKERAMLALNSITVETV